MELADFNFDCFESIQCEEVNELLSRSKLGFNVNNREDAFNGIKNSFDTLMNIEEIKPMVIYVSSFKGLQVIILLCLSNLSENASIF
jgi:hypothetical protein